MFLSAWTTRAKRTAATVAAGIGLAVALTLSAAAQRVTDTPGLETATFAGGCFWCVEADFDKIDGVVATTSGYMGGKTPNPTYQQISAGGTGHAEVVEIRYDPKKVSYQRLVSYFWRTIDPLDTRGQFCDHGDQYRTAIFYHSDAQRRAAEAARDMIIASKRFTKPLATEIVPATKFTPAEDYHQNYYEKNPGRYASYRAGCGRDARVRALWGDEAYGKTVSH